MQTNVDTTMVRYERRRGQIEAYFDRTAVQAWSALTSDGSVWYDVRAFSRPRYWPVRLAKRIARRLQARFVRDSKAAMRAAVMRTGHDAQAVSASSR